MKQEKTKFMLLRPFGNTHLNVSPIGLGTVKLGRNKGVKYPESFVIPDDKVAGELIGTAKDFGINLIDTAPSYGNSEERLGKLLAHQRKDWIICSKVGEEYDGVSSFFDFSAKHTRLSVERSLQRLRTDYVDIILIHSDGNDLDILHQHEALEELQKLKQEGLIRAYGMSTKTAEGGVQAAAATDAVMVSYNLEYRKEESVIKYCEQQNKGLLIKKAFASGHLSTMGEDPVQKSMDFIFSHKGISSVIVGTINTKHLEQNVTAVNRALSANH
ncbi:MAG: aryl-alcohol dehydrogenase-like predicted oxidoreductase [Oceanicoccus sp.]|jgi:aryl-alcohol dehydrogenase-like predicted oxidoreductase